MWATFVSAAAGAAIPGRSGSGAEDFPWCPSWTMETLTIPLKLF